MDVTQLKKSLKSFKLDSLSLDGYIKLYSKLHEKPKKISRWKSLRNPDEKKLVQYLSLPVPDKESIVATLARLAVCKLNGGLGTSMNCQGPKSAIIVREKKTFVDLLVEQVADFNKKYKADVPLLFMNSFNTHDKTERIIGKAVDAPRILSFCQHAYPRLLADDSGFLIPKKSNNDAWYPPGHGDLYSCIMENGYLDTLLKEGREYLFISNADNLGAVVDLKILNYLIDEDIPFLMEVTAKTPSDMKGGVLCQEKDQLKLLEVADVPSVHLAEFCGNEKFKFFNTNNIWINLARLKQILVDDFLDMDLIVNRKQIKKQNILQLETAVGSALNSFHDAVGINVPRSRFLPVKKTSDLLLVQSDLFSLDRGTLKRDSALRGSSLPKINLKEPFNDLKEFQQRIPIPPNIKELDSLELQGQVKFNGKVTLKGKVRLVSDTKIIRIPKGAVLDNKTIES